jgi:hypothetical protein
MIIFSVTLNINYSGDIFLMITVIATNYLNNCGYKIIIFNQIVAIIFYHLCFY